MHVHVFIYVCMCMHLYGHSYVFRAEKHASPWVISFAQTQPAAAKAAKATKRRQDGRKRNQPASNLLLLTTVKIPVESSYLSQSIRV